VMQSNPSRRAISVATASERANKVWPHTWMATSRDSRPQRGRRRVRQSVKSTSRNTIQRV
jgi:hypothetical protein